MAEYFSIRNKEIISLDPVTEAPYYPSIIKIKEKSGFNKSHLLPNLNEIPKKYIKIVDTGSGLFPFEMSQQEKNQADQKELVAAKKEKEQELEVEAYRRIVSPPDSVQDEGIFLGIDEQDQRNKTANAVYLLKKALDVHFASGVLSVLSQPERDKFAEIESIWSSVVTVHTVKAQIAQSTIENASSLEELKSFNFRKSSKWKLS